MVRHRIDWSQYEERLKTLWLQGLTSVEIAERFGFTVSSVIGKLGRMGLLGTRRKSNARGGAKLTKEIKSRTSSALDRKPQKKKQLTRVYEEPKLFSFEQEGGTYSEVEIWPAPFQSLRMGQCRWPIYPNRKDEQTLGFCAEPVCHGVYCERHHQRAKRVHVKRKAVNHGDVNNS